MNEWFMNVWKKQHQSTITQINFLTTLDIYYFTLMGCPFFSLASHSFILDTFQDFCCQFI